MIKKWDDYDPEQQQKLRAYMDNTLVGERLKAMATNGEGVDLDFAVWLLTADSLCGRNAAGLSILDLADFLWRDHFDNEVPPATALGDALRAEGLIQ